MNACCTRLLGSVLLMLVAAPSQATVSPEKLPETTFDKWSGSLIQLELADGSLLNEYMAQTMSESVDGTFLIVSFYPRFKCTPVISVKVGPDSNKELDSELSSLNVTIDDTSVEFPVLLDSDQGVIAYSMNSDQTGNSDMLAMLDEGSRATVAFSSIAPTKADDSTSESEQDPTVGAVKFSLMGSRKSAQAVKKSCHAHIPIAFEK